MLPPKKTGVKERFMADKYCLSPWATRVSQIGSEELNKQTNNPSKPIYNCGRLNAYLISFATLFHLVPCDDVGNIEPVWAPVIHKVVYFACLCINYYDSTATIAALIHNHLISF